MKCCTEMEPPVACLAPQLVFTITAIAARAGGFPWGVVFEGVVAMIVAVWLWAIREGQSEFKEIPNEGSDRLVGLER